MFRSVFSSGLLAIALHAGAQSYVHQVVVLNEGYFDFVNQTQVVPVTLGTYAPSTGTYQNVATIAGPRFASDVLVHEAGIYVAADDRILRYDQDDFSQLAMAEVSGVRKLAVWNDLLLLTRGELGGLPHYFEVRDLHTLAFVDAITPADGLPYSAEDVLVVDDKAYLAVGNAFEWSDLQGHVGIVDLTTMSYTGQVDLGPDGRNPEKLMLHGGDIIAFNNKDFSASSISRVDPVNSTLAYTMDVTVNSSCAASARVDSNGLVYFLEYAQNELARFDPSTGAVVDTLAGSPAVYGLIEDPINGVLYGTTTDYFSTGDLHVMDLAGQVLSTVAVGVAAGNLALDIRSSTGVQQAAAHAFRILPNPAIDSIELQGLANEGAQRVAVTDGLGRVVLERSFAAGERVVLNVAGLRAGLYKVRVNEGAAQRFTKL